MYRFWQLSSAWVSAPNPEEASALRELLNDDCFACFHDGEPLSIQEAEILCNGSQPWFHIHAPDGQLIGAIALLRGNGAQAELCIHITETWRGKGIGTEAVERMKIAACFGMQLCELYVRVLRTNARVLPFYKRCGFAPVSELAEHLKVPGAAESMILRCVLNPKPVSVSVIIPMHNSGKWLRRCVTSLAGAACEILLVDDASTDDTTQIAAELATQDERIRLLHCSAHAMAGGARNVGLRAAGGEYLFFLDSDDMVAETEIFARMAAFATVSRADCVMTAQYEEEGSRGSRLVRRWGFFSGPITETQRPKLYSCQFPVWMAWYRRDFLLKHCLTFPEQVSYEDNYFSFVLASVVDSVCFVPGTLIRHSVHEHSLAHIPDIVIQTSFFHVTDLCLDYIEKNDLMERYPRELALWYVHAVFFTALHIWRRILPTEFWIVREAIQRVKKHCPRFFTDQMDAFLSLAERECLKKAWERVEDLQSTEGE